MNCTCGCKVEGGVLLKREINYYVSFAVVGLES